MSYRPPVQPPKGIWARAIHAKRRADDLSQTELFELIGASLGFAAKSRTAFRAIDLGERQPTAAEAKVLADWLGEWPTDDEPAQAPLVSESAAIIAAIDRQTDVLRDVLSALTERTIDPVAVQALQAWAIAQATTRSPRRNDDPAPTQTR